MVKRKYLNFAVIFLLSYHHNSYAASALLPDQGHYKYYMGFATIDKTSKKLREARSQAFIEIQNKIHDLSLVKENIQKIAEDERRMLLNSEQVRIEQIDYIIDDLQEDIKDASSFSDDKMAYFEVKYGASNFQSFGLKIGYKEDKFADERIVGNNVTKRGRDLDVFYKHKIFSHNSFIVTLQPKLHYSTYSKTNDGRHFDMALLTGYSYKSKKKRHVSFYELGITVRKYA